MRAGTSAPTIHRYEGGWDRFELATLRKIGTALGVRVEVRFVDLYFYLRGGGSPENTFELLRRRFTNIDYNEYHLLKSLVFFDDAETEPMPRLLREVGWDDVKKTIAAEVQRLQRLRRSTKNPIFYCSKIFWLGRRTGDVV